MRIKLLAAALAGAGLISGQVHAQAEIQWWHSHTGALNEWVVGLANGFNASQKEYKVVPVYKGSYTDTMNAGIAAFRAGNPPHIIQIFEVGTATMMAAKGAVKPVAEVMREGGVKWDPKAYVPAVVGYYSTSKGEMLSFPFNSSTAVLFYNKDAFKAAGLDPNNPPVTWTDVTAAAARLKAAGHKCAFTTAWQGWVHLENFSAWHNAEFATKNNGFGGLDARLKFNSPLHVRHIENMANWAKQGLFLYPGRGALGDAKFSSGECAMFTGSSAAYGGVKRTLKADFGIVPLPYYADVTGAPQNTIIGGASLWVMRGKKPAEYKGVARFFQYLSGAEVQAKSHQLTGYLPITTAAYEVTGKQGFYQKNPGTDVSVKQMIVKTTDKSRGLRLGNMPQIRTIVDEELEHVWGGKKSAKQALDDAVRRGNEQLERFEKANKGKT